MIVIVDYGMGNLGSICNMLKRIGTTSIVSNSIEEIQKATKLILPGVGAFDAAMTRINESGLREVLNRKVLEDKVPVLGICLGMQLLTYGSEEGKLPGLGWIPSQTKKIPAEERLKIPHMGWNITHRSSLSPITKGLDQEEIRFYFVHSYAVSVDDPKYSILQTHYGINFDSGIQRDHIFGVQFHPEKSHRFGKKLLSNFVEL